ncbi:MAG: aspartyl protease family protein [Methanophagales archaeon]|nr:aspartyl protease family protein [Methanophagales archaeon]
MPAYDSAMFDPPAPVARVILRNPGNGATWSDVPMLLDSGADVTLIPQTSIDRLGLTVAPDKYYELIGFDGSVSLASVVQLELIFLNRVFRGQFLLIDQKWGILGRNILNAISLLLDGPRLIWIEKGPD